MAVEGWGVAWMGGGLQVGRTARPLRSGAEARLGEGLYHISRPLLPDAVVESARSLQRKVSAQQRFLMEVVVHNRGLRPVRGGQLNFEGLMMSPEMSAAVPQLAPGQREVIEVWVAPRDVSQRAVVEITHKDPDAHLEDNRRALLSVVLPDFSLRAMHMDGDHVQIEARELSGLQAAPVDVDVLLQHGDSLTTIGQLVFDPRDPSPLHLDVVGLAERPAPVQLIARINPARHIVEANYTNNQLSERRDVIVNLKPVDAHVSKGVARLTISVEGELPEDASVSVMLTEAPEEAADAMRSGWAPEHPPLIGSVVFSETGQTGQVEIPLPTGEGFLYAVVNPGHALTEQRRDDNTLRFSRTRRTRVVSDLQLESSREEICGDLALELTNTGDAPSLAAVLTLFGEDGFPIAEVMVPPAEPGGRVTVTFPHIPDGVYPYALRRLDRGSEDVVTGTLDPFTRAASLDADDDGYISVHCGGQDCVDDDSTIYPGSGHLDGCLLYTSPSPRDRTRSRMPSSA